MPAGLRADETLASVEKQRICAALRGRNQNDDDALASSEVKLLIIRRLWRAK